MSTRFPRLAADRRGVALPVALFGLVAVSLLVTTALLTSSTEYAISAAHRTAAGSLYNADAALEQYLFDRAQVGGRFLTATQNGAALAPDGQNYLIQVARLSWNPNVPPVTPGNMAVQELYSVVATPPGDRGRGVGAFISLRREVTPLNTNINAGATSGGNLKVSGNATISDGRSGTNYCNAQDSTSDYAVQVTRGSKIDLGNNAANNLEGVADTADFAKDSLAHFVLGANLTLRKLAEAAQIQFGPLYNQPDFQTTVISAAAGTDSVYNWGCPQALLSNFTCPGNSATKHVVVAIDAKGGTVKINGRYGQGMIIVLNGSLEIQGNFTYKGIILVEKDMFIRGGAAGQESKIEGGVIAFGSSSTVEDNITGTATIKYNICAIDDAEAALNQGALLNADQLRDGTTFAWYELIR
ncbi:MAG TPA: hypothetical protein VF006_03610 [Longimicrobium sp.]